jgi:hypothetical protein
MNYCWFWDLEKVFPGYPQFDVAENILHLGNRPKIPFNATSCRHYREF